MRIRFIVHALIALNLLTLMAVFAWPRWSFLQETELMTPEARMETSGSADMPNQYSLSYQVASRLEKLTSDDAVLFFPPGDKAGSLRGPLIQRLYPRRLVFADDADRDALLSADWGERQSILVFQGSELEQNCRGRKTPLQGVPEFWVCKL
ncbi:MAG: hypothetical protein G3M78_06265 [Candidatus Nitrohelix vancouverensis]|uniref:Uncharacterized protein n=1 Tax=Candidatus Nitrohelix vancouverensis TaxID=2705534 RepID=A0A7T0G367_9BACT|nr:MAG: hypothetical protein G3M78_06265 [Candidatus Nitrohelix vancouverensis]